MPVRLRGFLSLVLSLVLGGLLLWLALRGADFDAVGRALADGAWGWLVPYVLVGLASVAIRAWRWGILIDALPDRDGRVPLRLTSASVAIGYLVNYTAPRLGEVVRTANVARRAPASFSGVLGTVVAERVLDVLALGAALASVVVLFRDRIGGITGAVAENLRATLAAPPAWAVALAVVLVIAVAVVTIWFVRSGGGRRVAGALGAFRDGLASVVRSGRPGMLVLSTILLWICYGLMADLPLRLLGLDAAYGLGPLDAWAVMAIGGIGMALPSPGGTGSFHYATVEALTLLFGVAVTPAATYALLVHASGLVFYAVLGAIALAAQGSTLGSLTQAARAETA